MTLLKQPSLRLFFYLKLLPVKGESVLERNVLMCRHFCFFHDLVAFIRLLELFDLQRYDEVASFAGAIRQDLDSTVTRLDNLLDD